MSIPHSLIGGCCIKYKLACFVLLFVISLTFVVSFFLYFIFRFARTKCRLRLGFVGLRVIISRTHHHRMVWILWKAVDVHIVALVVGRNRILDFQRWQSDLLRFFTSVFVLSSSQCLTLWLTNCYYSLYAIFFHLGMSFDSVSSWQHEFAPKVSVSSTQSSTCLWSGEFGAEFVTRLFENLWWTNRKVKNYWR